MEKCYRVNPKMNIYLTQNGDLFTEGQGFAPRHISDLMKKEIKDARDYLYFIMGDIPVVLQEGIDVPVSDKIIN